MIAKRILTLTVACIFLGQLASASAFQFGRSRDDLVGSWTETVTVTGPGAPPPFKSLGVYNEDGTSVFSDQGSVRTSAGQVFSSTVGVWEHLRNRTFAYTGGGLISDLEGNPIGSLKIRGEITVDRRGNSYTGRIRVDAFDPGGTLLISFDGTIEAQRIRVEPLN